MIGGILNNIDIYGHAIGVHYRGSGTYTTRLGGSVSRYNNLNLSCFITLVTFTLICINALGLFTQFVDHSN